MVLQTTDDLQANFVQIAVRDNQYIKYVQQADKNPQAADGSHTDLIPGVYEGMLYVDIVLMTVIEIK